MMLKKKKKLPKAPFKAIYKNRFQLHIQKVAGGKHYTIAFFSFFQNPEKQEVEGKKGIKKKNKRDIERARNTE